MKKLELAELANRVGVSDQYLGAEQKTLIREIQRALGHDPCYMTDARYSCNKTCEWSANCKKLVAEWRR